MKIVIEIWDWFRTLLSGRPHFYIGGRANPQLLRWYLIPRNNLLNIYLHKFLRSDDDRALHDHPWWFISWVIRGEYVEHNGDQPSDEVYRPRWSIAYRPAEHAHRVELGKDRDQKSAPCWTILITGPKVREWGFYCPRGWVIWTDFVDHKDEGNVGKGCGE